jgi:hypothetical protein
MLDGRRLAVLLLLGWWLGRFVKGSVGKAHGEKQPGGVRIAVWFQLQSLTRDGTKCRIRNWESREAAHEIKITAAT